MMKKITLMFTLLAMSLGFSQNPSLPYDFGTAAAPTLHGMVPGDGAMISNAVDPDDAADSVMQIIGNGTSWDNAQVDFGTQIDLSDNDNNAISFRFKATTGDGVGTHALKFELGTTGDTQVIFESTDNEWKTYTLDLPAGLGQYTRMVIFTDFGDGNTNSGTYLVDDIIQTSAPCVSPVLSTTPIDFSSPEDAAFVGGDGAIVGIIDDGGNDVLQVEGNGTTWDNAQVSFCDPQDLSDNDNNTVRFKIKPASAGAAEVRQHGLKFEGGDPVAISEFNFSTTGSDWQDIEVDFPGGLGTFTKMVIFVDTGVFGVGGDNALQDTYLIDDITLGATVLGVNDFEVNAFSVYPNPSPSNWTIKTKNESITAIQLYDVLGKQVLSLAPNKDLVTIDGSSLKAGLYFAQLKTATGIKSLKLIKQ
ncbi:T9SS type A sorting domain-containing protein [Algibacter mikhailovii]|uniref:T9SS type A sorting domain-containing protein n=1 Tax=Algibacter mikhailovii TaxID=425498 RepID=UPI00249415EB|nr:T9SS type A sorting domain-containing protein [Algibacter mikhailovii]